MNTFITENIDKLTQRELPDGSWEIAFESCNEGLCHQLYADGALRDWTESLTGRRFLLPNGQQRQDIAIAAVPIADRAMDFSALLPAVARKADWLFSQSVMCVPGPGSPGKLVLLDDHAGQSPPTCVAALDSWPACQARYGLGQDIFGLGGFGFGGTGAPGMGKGVFAIGRFGFDADAIRLEVQLREEGLHHIAMGAVRDDGQTAFLPAQAVLVFPPPPPTDIIEAVSYDPLTSTLTLHIE